MKRTILLFLLMVGITSFGVNGQDRDSKTWVSINIGTHQYDGDFTNEIFKTKVYEDVSVGLGIHRYLNNTFDLNYEFNYGSLDTDDMDPGFRKLFLSNNLMIDFNFANDIIFNKDASIRPFLGAGYGVSYFFGESETLNDEVYQVIPLQAGLEFPISNGAVLELKSTYNRSLTDRIDGESNINREDHDDFVIHSIGLKFRLFGAKDSDGDGVKDKVDKCVDTAGSPETNGCPDNDSDGIINSQDLCPDVAGTAANRGCADSDGDSIVDFEDACPNIAGSPEFQGCADTDGDKIPDGEDLCPEVKGTTTTDGCPDDDGDGIKNSVDLCPVFAGTAEFGGCPDSDGDGIIDKEDNCPSLEGIKPNNGCPEVTADVKRKLDVIFQNLLFATNSANIDPTSLDDLDELVKIMNDDEDLRLSIEGHTDNRGNNDYNLELSRLRAEAVKQHLINGGISASRIKAVGYGETRPLTTNDTANGRLKNRRVELNISYK
jgi:OOP family OmpA-OmpF porin